MGWRFQIGATRSCKIENGILYVDTYPNPLEFEIQLPYTTDWQRNMFIGEEICFVLVCDKEKRIAIGDEFGKVSLLTYDGILAGLTTWSVPLLGMDYRAMGYYTGKNGMYTAYVSPLDPYVVHAARRSMILPEPVPVSVFCSDFEESGLAAQSMSALIGEKFAMAAVTSEGHITAKSGEWFVDPSSDITPYLILGEGA